MSDERSVRYRDAGVDLERAARSLAAIGETVASTYDERVLAGIGAFGGLFALGDAADTVLVASTDGVGTKTLIAVHERRYREIGSDLVNHCINDVLVQGATPLFFLDYLAAAQLDPAMIAELVGGVADACRAVPMPLLGGETAEMPGVYRDEAFDLVGTLIGAVPRHRLIDGSSSRPGDRVLALASGGLQTNGFSLARALLGDALHEPLGGGTVADALLAPHRSFLPAVAPLLAAEMVRAMAHITGGGIPGNLPRVLPAGLGAELHPDRWPEPPIFELIRRRGGVSEPEMRSTFNLGLGLLIVIPAERLAEAQALCPEPLLEVGEITGDPGIRFV